MQKRKIISCFLFFLLSLTVISCSGREKLLMLNWGEYISDEVVSDFEEKYNCDVVISLAESNELFYSKVKGGTTVYDIVVPSDYMVEKMYQNDLLSEIDFSKIPNYNSDIFLPGVNDIIRDMNLKYDGIKNYFVPYFWGTWGIMYNKSNPEVVDAVTKASNSNNPWTLLFERNTLPQNAKIGMYDIPRYAYSAVMFYNNIDINLENDNNLKIFANTLKKAKFDIYSTDTLKKQVASGNLDLAFMWTGDFLDMLYTDLASSTDVANLNYDIFIPENTIAFMDNLVITKNARNKDLAYKFINFLLEKDNAIRNASVVGYCTPLNSVYNEIVNYKPNSNNKDDIWLTNWAYAINKYYPLINNEDKHYQGTVLSNMNRDYLNNLITIFNNSKVGN